MTDDLVEQAYRAHMRSLGRKGGATTKRRLEENPLYYREIGRAGGRASVAARRAQLAGEIVTPKPAVPVGVRAETPAVSQPAIVNATGAVESNPKTAAVATLDAILDALNAPLKLAKLAHNG